MALVVKEISNRKGLLERLKEAEYEIENRRSYFNLVSEPELVEEAIYSLLAAEKRYSYLLRRAREEGLTHYSRPEGH